MDTLKIIEKTNPDLILMDIILKGDLNGIETVKIIMNYMIFPISI